MARLRMGAKSAKVTHLSIVVTGGRPDSVKHKDLLEGMLMALLLEKEVKTSVKLIEDQSNTTQENAVFKTKILKQNQIDTIYLVNHVWHMPRSKIIFEKEGLQAIPICLWDITLKNPLTPLDFTSTGKGLTQTREIWHEILGKVSYELYF